MESKNVKRINREVAINCAIQYRWFLAQYSVTGVYGNTMAADRYKEVLTEHGLSIEDVEDESDNFLKAIGK